MQSSPKLEKDREHGHAPFFTSHALVQHPEDGWFRWTSRNIRKGRHRLMKKGSEQSRYHSNLFRRILRIFTALELGSLAWWVAMLFTIGSIVWCINGVYVFVPFVNSHMAKNLDAGGWTSWLGATIFEFGAAVALLEAWTLRKATSGRDESSESSPVTAEQSPHLEEKPHKVKPVWHDIGFLAAAVQYPAATIFWIAGWTGLPVIFNTISKNTGLTDGVYWTPQVIGGSGFVISGALYMLENQKRWYLPAITSLGWHIGFWNFIGGVGFTFCPIFGYSMKEAWQYASCLSTFIGGWAFLIGSVLQWYEAVNPVSPEPADSKSMQDGAQGP